MNALTRIRAYSARSAKGFKTKARLAASGAMLLATPAGAQQILQGPLLSSDLPLEYDRGRNTGVLERERPDYEAEGIRRGAFIILPRVEVSGGYSDNVYGLSADKTGDAFLAVDPSVQVESDWTSHSLVASAGAQLRRFADQTRRNETGLYARAAGHLEITRAASLDTGAYAQRSYEQRYSGSFPTDALGNVEYVTAGSYLRGRYDFGRLRAFGSAEATRVNFNDVQAIGGGVIDQDDRDRTVLRVGSRAEYGFTPDASVFLQISHADTDYDRLLATGVANRDSKEWRALAGLSFDLTALIRGRFGVGYVKRSFRSPLYGDIGGLAADARLEYFLTELTTITVGARRYIEDANLVGSGGYFANGVSAKVDHELLRNLLLNAGVDYESDDFEGIRRKDNIFIVSAGARYLVNRSVGLGFNLSHINRDSKGDLVGPSFDENRGTVSLILQR